MNDYRLPIVLTLYRISFFGSAFAIIVRTIAGPSPLYLFGLLFLVILAPGLKRDFVEKHFNLCAHGIVLSLAIISTVLVWMRGGIHSDATRWILVIPAFSAFLLTPRMSIIYGGYSIFQVALATYFFETGKIGRPLPESDMAFVTQTIVFSMIVVLSVSIFNKVRFALDQSIRKMAQAEKKATLANRAKSDFLANMSHEIRTPLNGIFGATELLKDDSPTAEQKELLNTIHESSVQLLTILNGVLDIAKIEAGKMDVTYEEVDLERLLETLRSIFNPLAELRGLKFHLEIDPQSERKIISDELKLKQILGNLIANAIKFTHQGFVNVKVHANVESYTFTVEDSGKGIAKENIAILFDKFAQEDNSITRQYGGTGLGLTITKKLVDILDGSINVESEVNKGSKFTVILQTTAKT